MPKSFEDLLDILARLEIDCTTHEHPAVFTVEEAARYQSGIAGAHTRNLFFKDKKQQMFLVVTLAEKPLDIKDLARKIGGKNLSFGKPDLLRDVLGVIPGSVTPFAAVNVPDTVAITVVLDEEMMAHEILNFHPLVNTATTSIRSADLIRFLEHCGQPPRIIML
jgi:Ala-tRNA(Pro) deacylase